MLRKVLGVFLISTSIQCYPNMSQELNHIMDKAGFATNVTGAQAYSTQAAGFLTGGALQARNQVRNIQLMHITTPTARGGCSGIDITAGGFSFINSGQMIQFMQNLLSSVGAYAFNLALETELPEMAHSMQYIQNLANKINSNNLNSCEMGESLVGALWSKNRRASQHICEEIGSQDNMFSDWAKARHECATGGSIDSTLEKAKKDDRYKDRLMISTNLVWDMLQKNNFLNADAKLAETYMSVSGTMVFNKDGALSLYPSLANNKNFIRALMYGGKLPVYKCEDTGHQGKCLNVSYSPSSYQTINAKDALVFQVQGILQSIYKHIQEGSALSAKDSGLIEMTKDNVFSLIASNAEQGIGLQGSYELSQAIAADLLAQYLSTSIDIVRASLAGKDLSAENHDLFMKNIQQAQNYVGQFVSDTRSKLNQSLATNQLIQSNVKQALSKLNPLLRQAYRGAE